MRPTASSSRRGPPSGDAWRARRTSNPNPNPYPNPYPNPNPNPNPYLHPTPDPNPNPKQAREADLLRMQLGLPPLAKSPLFAPVSSAPARR